VEDQFIGGEATRKAHPARFGTPGLDVELGFGDADGQVGIEDRVRVVADTPAPPAVDGPYCCARCRGLPSQTGAQG
jgi:hypothetical protein